MLDHIVSSRSCLYRNGVALLIAMSTWTDIFNLWLMAEGANAELAWLQQARAMPAQRFALMSADEQALDISQLRPDLQCQWDHQKNAHLGGITITPGSNRKVWWTCDCCPLGLSHEWESTVNNRTGSQQRGCPFCASKAVCPHNALDTNNLDVAAEWSQNNLDSPACYTVKSQAKKLWCCKQCGYEWAATIANHTSLQTGCPNCFRVTQKGKTLHRQPPVTDSQHAMTCWDREQNKQAGLDPSELTCGSHKTAHWICPSCPKGQPHRWQSPTFVLSHKSHGAGCPCCSGRQACVCNSLQSLHPDIAAEWDHDRNEATPADYTAHSRKLVWWYNSKRGCFQARIHNRTQYKKVTYSTGMQTST